MRVSDSLLYNRLLDKKELKIVAFEASCCIPLIIVILFGDFELHVVFPFSGFPRLIYVSLYLPHFYLFVYRVLYLWTPNIHTSNWL